MGDNTDAFPTDPTESVDADGDGVGANSDFDDSDPAVGAEPDAILSVTSAEVEVGYTVRIFLEVSDVVGLNALDASLNFDPSYLELVNVSLEPSISDWLFQSFSPAQVCSISQQRQRLNILEAARL